MTDVELRPDRGTWVRYAVGGVAGLAILVVTGVLTGNWFAFGATLLMALGVWAHAYRRTRSAVVAAGDTLTVRNPWRTHRLARADVRAVRVASRHPGWQAHAWVERTDGRRVPLVTVDDRNDLAAMEAEVAALEAWRTGPVS